MRGRLFQRLKQGIEGGGGEHVHFVDDIDLVTPLVGGKVDLVAQVAHVVDAGVGGGVDLDQVQEAPLEDGLAVRALAAGTGSQVIVQAVDRLGQDARQGGLAGAARPGEQVGVRPACRQPGRCAA